MLSITRNLYHTVIKPNVALITPKSPEYEEFLSHISNVSSDPKIEQHHTLFVSKVNPHILGSSYVTLSDKTVKIEGIYVPPRLRNQGIGSGLLKSMLVWAKEQGADAAVTKSEFEHSQLFQDFIKEQNQLRKKL